jgi:tRNA(adenine34) deaminase
VAEYNLQPQQALFTGQDKTFMTLALQQAQLAWQCGEVPVGAVLVDAQGNVVGAGYNRTITDNDPTAHAEVVALRNAAQALQNYRLPGLTMYVTLEPCAMCIGAMLHARLDAVVYGATDPKTGACGSVLSVHAVRQLNHQTRVQAGLMAQECSQMLRDFFRERRAQAAAQRACCTGSQG